MKGTNVPSKPDLSRPNTGRATRERPIVDLSALEDHEVVAEVLSNLIADDPRDQAIFSVGRKLSVVGGNRTHQLTVASLRTRVSAAMRFVRVIDNGGGLKTVSLPDPLVRAVHDEPVHGVPELTRIVNAPFFAPDGSLVSEPGHHPATQSYYVPNGLELPMTVRSKPTPREVQRARTLITEDLLGDFPFAGPADLANAVSVLLVPFVRDMIDGATPLHNFDAPVRGSGKGKLTRLLLYPALGRWPESGPIPRTEAEMEKSLLAILAASPSVTLFDNVSGRVASDSLASALSEPTYSSRVLKKTQYLTMPVRTIWAMTGNNASFSPDIGRRVVWTRIDPRTDRPENRTDFRHADIESWAKANRGELVWAALTLISHWVAGGGIGGSQTFGSYEQWVAVMGGILDAAEIYGFMDNREEFLDRSVTEDDAWVEVVELWAEEFGVGTLVKASALQAVIAQHHGVDLDIDFTDPYARKMGHALRGVRDRIISGYRIEPADGSERKTRDGKGAYRLVAVRGVRGGSKRRVQRETSERPVRR